MRTALVVACGVPLTLACGLRAIQLAACGARGAKRHAVARAWARSILWISRVRVSVSGADRIAPGRPYILMANHQGNYDIPILLAHLPVEFRWLAKAELFRIPVFGHAMRAIGCIAIDRADRESAFASLERAAGVLNRGIPVMIFPEGTRSPDGTLLPFKKGGFVLAIRSGVPVVPVAVHGSRAIMPKGGCRIRGGKVALGIGHPISTSGLRPEDKDDLMRAVRSVLAPPVAES
jgi:1-acyl-sn-glycerol-3-phosphate acyltransferase